MQLPLPWLSSLLGALGLVRVLGKLQLCQFRTMLQWVITEKRAHLWSTCCVPSAQPSSLSYLQRCPLSPEAPCLCCIPDYPGTWVVSDFISVSFSFPWLLCKVAYTGMFFTIHMISSLICLFIFFACFSTWLSFFCWLSYWCLLLSV